MRTDFDVASSYRFAPATVFNSEFNNFAPISANQAWSLFFTAGRDSETLGSNPELGKILNNVLLAVVSTFVLGAFTFFSL
ncbi:MAG: hypothetical protein ICV85_22865 [Tolypothrix sp. T3-bin4]|nr:hypothetical protein [Tolypothrix sp. T3-bin4]